MKKILAVLVAVLMMAAFTVPALAEISPTAPVITTGTTTPGGSNNSSTAPQTGYSLLIPVAAMAVAGGAGILATKLSKKG